MRTRIANTAQLSLLLLMMVFNGNDEAHAQLFTRFRRTKPCPAKGIPKAQYQVNVDSQSVTAISERAILVDQLEIDVIDQIDQARQENELSQEGLLQNLSEEVRQATDLLLKRRKALAVDLNSASKLLAVQQAEAAVERAVQRLNQSSKLLQDVELDRSMVASRQALAGLSSELDAERIKQGTADIVGLTQAVGSSVVNRITELDATSSFLRGSENSILGLSGLTDLRLGQRAIPTHVTGARDSLARVRTKLLQFQDGLSVDHCQISQIAVEIENTGRWNLKLLAQQNPNVAVDGQLPTAHLRQNEFVVQLRFYGEFQSEPLTTNPVFGRPALAQVDAIEFYVRNGQPYHLFVSRPDNSATRRFNRDTHTADRYAPRVQDRNVSLLLRRYFDRIDRAVVSFHYRGGSSLPLSRSTFVSD